MEKSKVCWQADFLQFCGSFGLRGIIEFLNRWRDQMSWEVARFNDSLCPSVVRLFCDDELLILLF